MSSLFEGNVQVYGETCVFTLTTTHAQLLSQSQTTLYPYADMLGAVINPKNLGFAILMYQKRNSKAKNKEFMVISDVEGEFRYERRRKVGFAASISVTARISP